MLIMSLQSGRVTPEVGGVGRPGAGALRPGIGCAAWKSSPPSLRAKRSNDGRELNMPPLSFRDGAQAPDPESRDSPMRDCASEVWSFGPSRNDEKKKGRDRSRPFAFSDGVDCCALLTSPRRAWAGSPATT